MPARRLTGEEAFKLVERVLQAYGVGPGDVMGRVRERISRMGVEASWEGVLDTTLSLMASWEALEPLWGRVASRLVLERIYAEAGKKLVEPRGIERRLSWRALKLLASRYLLKSGDGRAAETPDDMVARVAGYVALAEAGGYHYYYQRFYRLISSLRFLPNSPTLMNAGTRIPQLAACFTVPVWDDTDSIFEAVKVSARIFRTGAGAGYDFTPLRPRGSPIAGTGGRSSGPVSFMRVFDVAADTLKEGGKRRAAMMGILSDLHADLIEFVESKCGGGGVLEGFNISVAAHDEFLRRALSGGEWRLYDPSECPLIVGALSSDLAEVWRHCRPARVVDAREVFGRIAECAWASGDPGLVFIDTINAHNPTPSLGRIRATNPCGEAPLLDWEACNLGSINLEAYVDPRAGRILWDELAEDVKLAVRFLDDVIEVSRYPDKRIEEAVRRTRKIGLGVMGWADALALLGIPYDSHDALYLADKVMEFISYNAWEASAELAEERGAYPEFQRGIHRDGRLNWEPQTPAEMIYKPEKVGVAEELVSDRPPIDWESLKNRVRRGVRNAAVTAIAPTGSISIIAGVNGSIEPFFALVYVRHTDIGSWIEVNKHLHRWLEENGMLEPGRLEEIALRGGGVRRAPWAPEDLKRRLPTALEIGWEWHVRMQAAFQRWVDQAVSKTINMPETAKPEDVWEAYTLAHRLGCKGITVFRDKSREAQVLQVDSHIHELLEQPPSIPRGKDKSHYTWLRLRKGDIVAVHEEYAGGCPTCDT